VEARVARIFIVDDHHFVRMQLRHLLESFAEWEVCAEATNGREAVEKHGTVEPHITVMDFQLPEFNGVEASRLILQRNPKAAILLITAFPSNELVHQARKQGIRGFCSKENVRCIIEAIKSLLRGGTYFPIGLGASAGG
jgi:DNA-binding NarL/FixJ family response regulator